MHDCEKCSKNTNKSNTEIIPYIVHEADMAKADRRVKHMLFVVIVSISSLLMSNLAWLIAWVA